jgi:peptidoglycan biosynthesis protein MviN/MurJ (putative lipid II flippase)
MRPMSAGVAQDTPTPPDLLATAEASTARSSVVVSIGSLVSGVLGALLAFLIALIVGEGPETDGFLAAYAVYLALILFGTTLRVALVPILGPTGDVARFRTVAAETVSRVLAVAGLAVLVLVAASPVIGYVLLPGAPGDARDTAALSTAVLGVAAFCQIWGALLSAVLAAVKRFVASAVIYALSSSVTVAVASVLMAVGDVWGAAIGVLAGAAVLLAGHVLYLRTFRFAVVPSWRPAIRRRTWALAALAFAGASLPVCFQLQATISLAAVSGDTGSVTAFSYAYFLTVLLTSTTGGVIGMVTMPDLITALHERGRAAAREYMDAMAPFSVFFYLPLATGYAVFGWPVLDGVFGDALSSETISQLWDVSRILLVMGLVWCLLVPASTIALSLKMFRQLAVIAGAMIVVHFALVVPVSSEGVTAVAAMHAVSGSLVIVLVVLLVFGRDWMRAIGTAVRASLPAAALALVFPALGLAGLADSGVVAACAGLVLGAILYGVLGVALWPSVGRQSLRLLLSRA